MSVIACTSMRVLGCDFIAILPMCGIRHAN
jgi:hypothetical protein